MRKLLALPFLFLIIVSCSSNRKQPVAPVSSEIYQFSVKLNNLKTPHGYHTEYSENDLMLKVIYGDNEINSKVYKDRNVVIEEHYILFKIFPYLENTPLTISVYQVNYGFLGGASYQKITDIFIDSQKLKQYLGETVLNGQNTRLVKIEQNQISLEIIFEKTKYI